MIIDYNGNGDWSLEALRCRYFRYAAELGVPSPSFPEPLRQSEGDCEWIYPAMDGIIHQAAKGDKACVELLLEIIESEHNQPFGRLIKVRAAIILRRSKLTKSQVNRIRRRVLSILDSSRICFEFRQYARLLRSVGLPENWLDLCQNADRTNRFVRKHFDYFEKFASIQAGEKA